MTPTLTLEVPMPKRFNPAANLIAEALQTPAQKAAQRQAEEARAATAKQRAARKKLSPRETIAALTVGRTQAREAREYAERWYQALWLWDVREVKLGGSFHYDGPGDFTPLTLGSNMPTPARYLSTPAGEFDEGSVGQLITEMARAGTVEMRHLGKLLDRVRNERSACPESLLHANGRGWSGERGVRYGVAVLTLAVQLRDAQAETALQKVRACLK